MITILGAGGAISNELVKLLAERKQPFRLVGRNPKTGQEVPISPRRVLIFRASHALKDQINLGAAEPNEDKTRVSRRAAAKV